MLMPIVLLFSTSLLAGILLLNGRGLQTQSAYSLTAGEPVALSPIQAEDSPLLENGLNLIHLSTITVTASYVGPAQPLLDRDRDWLIIPRGAQGVSIYDVSGPANPLLLTTINSGIINGDAGAVALASNQLFVARPFLSDVAVIDITNLTNPQFVGAIAEHPSIHALEVKGDRLYVFVGSCICDGVFYPGGTYVFSISTTIPTPMGHYLTNLTDLGAFVTDDGIFFQARTPAAADDPAGVDVIDLSDPAHPTPLGSWRSDTPGNIWDLDLVGDYLYAAAYWGGIWVLDVSDLSQISRIAHFDWDDWEPHALSLAVRPPHIVIAQDSSGPKPAYKPHFSLLTLHSNNQLTLDQELPVRYFPTNVSLADDWLVMEESGNITKLVHLYQVIETQKQLYLPLSLR